MADRRITQIATARRGQIVISDLIVSLSIFLILVVIAYQAWNQQITSLERWREEARADDALERGLDALTRNSGHPSSWAAAQLYPNDTALISIGAAQDGGVIDPLKLSRIEDYLQWSGSFPNDTRTKMGVGAYRIEGAVRGLDGTPIASLGDAPGSGASVLAAGQRLARYQNQTVWVSLRIWRNESG